ncbi:carbonic anhydrase [Janthinobacterium agaricidamnosum]|uniref:carbonic anhydrase n=1 Tax=Janthinobacterium agaricidamnosum NBRC 102515 = DSM 9628 TaxID=1349767 RepID=W0V0V8_9BURK|nr:carbonic anhydrase family protein [Janthinobacterium agaricidamnosum]CDG81491.1 eukaryotic-type carbonic anhydrase family protein [Janthinobacterium agaricidamnosum NBRC 102515 = DSM 9628]
MRNLSALLVCSLAMMTASANDVPAPGSASASAAASASAPASAAAKAAAAKTLTESVKKPVAPRSSAASAAAARAAEDQSELDLSAKIAARLAEMRANQAARAAHAAKARKAATAAAAARAAAPVPPPVPQSTDWSYEGDTGPDNWGKINSSWAQCGNGTRQSPIDLRDGMKVDLEQISFDYKPSSFTVIDNGHTILVTVGSGNYITVQNHMYELVQFHFHRPSEERINGKGYEMVVHLVHRDGQGKLAMLAILLERGNPQSTIQTVWNNLPLEKKELVTPAIVLDPAELLPQKRDYFTYMGSMTEPPCTEGVLWMVMKQPQQASPDQMALFSRLYPFNVRPIQNSNGRVIKESN